jgi:hypothetical protein
VVLLLKVEKKRGNKSIEEYSIIVVEDVDSTMRKMMTMFSPHFEIFIVEIWQHR